MSLSDRVFILAAVVALTGCVSLGRYHALQRQDDVTQRELARQERETGGLKGDLGEVEDSNTVLAQNKTALEARNEDLEQSEADLANQDTALAAQKAALENEKDELQAQALEKQAQYDLVMGNLNDEVKAGLLQITQYKNMLTLNVADKILFDSAKADLKPAGEAVLLKVGKAFAHSDKLIRVVGNTDNVPLAEGAGFAGNWELSTARAVTVVRFLQEHAGIDPTRLVASGRGEWMPVAPNDSAANRQKNRRIEITLIDRSLVDGIEGISPSAKTL